MCSKCQLSELSFMLKLAKNLKDIGKSTLKAHTYHPQEGCSGLQALPHRALHAPLVNSLYPSCGWYSYNSFLGVLNFSNFASRLVVAKIRSQ